MQLTSLPRGSGEVELMGLLPIFYVYDYIEQTEQWGTISEFGNSILLKRKIKEGRSYFILDQMRHHASDTLAYVEGAPHEDLNICTCKVCGYLI